MFSVKKMEMYTRAMHIRFKIQKSGHAFTYLLCRLKNEERTVIIWEEDMMMKLKPNNVEHAFMFGGASGGIKKLSIFFIQGTFDKHAFYCALFYVYTYPADKNIFFEYKMIFSLHALLFGFSASFHNKNVILEKLVYKLYKSYIRISYRYRTNKKNPLWEAYSLVFLYRRHKKIKICIYVYFTHKGDSSSTLKCIERSAESRCDKIQQSF